jgi:hypothetical protein
MHQATPNTARTLLPRTTMICYWTRTVWIRYHTANTDSTSAVVSQTYRSTIESKTLTDLPTEALALALALSLSFLLGFS